jgi:hypothetical protein
MLCRYHECPTRQPLPTHYEGGTETSCRESSTSATSTYYTLACKCMIHALQHVRRLLVARHVMHWTSSTGSNHDQVCRAWAALL